MSARAARRVMGPRQCRSSTAEPTGVTEGRFTYLDVAGRRCVHRRRGQPHAMYEVLERELKWEVDDDFVLPRFDDIVKGADVEHSTVHLTGSFYDTADGDLRAHGVLLRRRDGDDGTGWQLKVPDVEGRVWIRTTRSDTPPSSAHRSAHRYASGQAVGEHRDHPNGARSLSHQRARALTGWAPVDVDQVRASVDDRLLAWREIEVELGPTTKSDTARASRPAGPIRSLSRPGIRPSSRAPRTPNDRRPLVTHTPPRPSRTTWTRRLMRVFVGDLGLRRGSDPIHDTRVAIRRLRSTLRVFGKLLDPRGDLRRGGRTQMVQRAARRGAPIVRCNGIASGCARRTSARTRARPSRQQDQ